uniref:Uncharacterized protein n=1 Tax=Arundo donax TaxID=35708 RepID=A0A0A9D1L9_ARUDO
MGASEPIPLSSLPWQPTECDQNADLAAGTCRGIQENTRTSAFCAESLTGATNWIGNGAEGTIRTRFFSGGNHSNNLASRSKKNKKEKRKENSARTPPSCNCRLQ